MVFVKGNLENIDFQFFEEKKWFYPSYRSPIIETHFRLFLELIAYTVF